MVSVVIMIFSCAILSSAHNAALLHRLDIQDLTMHLFKQDNGNIERARVYINTGMDDAKSYNNRLRILEISQKLPIIVSTYHKRLTTQNSTLRYAVWGISLLVVTGRFYKFVSMDGIVSVLLTS